MSIELRVREVLAVLLVWYGCGDGLCTALEPPAKEFPLRNESVAVILPEQGPEVPEPVGDSAKSSPGIVPMGVDRSSWA